MRLYADQKGWPLERARVAVTHAKDAGQVPPDRFDRSIGLEGPLTDEQRARLLEIAERCPVHRTLEGGSRITTAPLPPDPPRGDPCDHFEDMQAECAKAG
jgi:putative redox protein